MMGWYDGGAGWGGWVLMTLTMLVFWTLVVVGGVALYRSLRQDDRRSPTDGGSAERLLDERFARGEIDAEEYRQRRDLLRSSR